MTTLKISDLSVGDWVRDGNGIIAKVRGIENWSNGYILNVQTVSGSICTLSVTGALPIPITAKILEKNGFVEHCGGIFRYEWMWQGESSGITLCSFDEELWFVDLFFKEGKDIMCNIPTFNVHQLQHILRLAGVDKEINL